MSRAGTPPATCSPSLRQPGWGPLIMQGVQGALLERSAPRRPRVER